jgi:hypothetical protein
MLGFISGPLIFGIVGFISDPLYKGDYAAVVAYKKEAEDKMIKINQVSK